MQTLFPYNGATVSFKHWPAGHSANNVADADLLSAVVLQVHSVPSEHKQSLAPFQDIIQEYLCQPNKTTAGKTVWFAMAALCALHPKLNKGIRRLAVRAVARAKSRIRQ